VVLRLLFGLIKGLMVGGVLGALLVFGLGMPTMAAGLAYVAALVAGALTGLVAGKPIWVKDARIEAGLKAAAGAVMATAAMFAIRRWLDVALDLGALGKGLIGNLPIASLPMIATALALFFEIDNTGDDGAKPGDKRATPFDKRRIEALDGDSARSHDLTFDEQEPAPSKKVEKS
jgi:hypothetical protein